MVLKRALDLFKQGKPVPYGKAGSLTSAEVQAWIDELLKWLKWKSKKLEGPECPWGECPPEIDLMRKLSKKPAKRP
jgi:hypothetical protein